jgi:hypothetical protein
LGKKPECPNRKTEWKGGSTAEKRREDHTPPKEEAWKRRVQEQESSTFPSPLSFNVCSAPPFYHPFSPVPTDVNL